MFVNLRTIILYRAPKRIYKTLKNYRLRRFEHGNLSFFVLRNKSCGCGGGKKMYGERGGYTKKSESFVERHLMLINTVTTGVLMGVGDLTQQEIEYHTSDAHKESFDWERCKNMALTGFLLGPLTHYFYKFLDQKFPKVNLRNVTYKLILDTVVSSPLYITIFFICINLLNGENYENTKRELRQKFMSVYIMECCVWVPCQFFNFYFVSPQFRVFYMNIVNLCHNVILSYLKHCT